MTSKFPELQEAAQHIHSHEAILDCEGTCLREGRSVFDDSSYRGRLRDERKIRTAVKTHPATYVAFDVLYTGQRHLGEPLIDRKQRLADILELCSVITPTLYVDGTGKQ